MKKRISVFGTGREAVACLDTLRNNYDIMYFLDNNKEKLRFCGKAVKHPNEADVHQFFIVVCTNAANYIQIAEQLKSYGLVEFKDFCFVHTLEKKIVVVHGNCHMTILKQYMMSSDLFNREYYIYPIPLIQHIEKGYIDDQILENCNVFIHQDIRKNNPYGERLSDDYIIPRLGEKCINITVPNLYNNFGKAFFPQQIYNISNPMYHDDPKGMFPYGDKNIEELIRQGVKNIDEILQFLKGKVYSKEFVKQEFERCKNNVLEREKNWNVKIVDYILTNYKSKKLFYDTEHPCNNVIREICRGVFRILCIDCQSIKEINKDLGIYEEPVYPCVMEALEIEWEEHDLRKEGIKLTEEAMDFNEYYREYMCWCYGM